MATDCDHTSVGMLIKNKSGNLLLIERKLFPYGFAPPAGHVDKHGSYEQAAEDEVREEVGLSAIKLKLIAQGRKENKCRRIAGDWHYWKIYKVEAEGELKPSQNETKQAGWFNGEQVMFLAKRTGEYLKGGISESSWQDHPGLEAVWYEWFKELGVI